MERVLPGFRSIRLKFVLCLGTAVTLFVAAVFYWMYQQSTRGVIAQLDQQSRILLQQIILTRAWVADHGGLFVFKQPGVEANPFLPATDVQDQEGKTYVFRNPAMVTREISRYADRAGLYKFRLTSLKLKNSANAPLPFEHQALLQFKEQGYERSREGLVSLGKEEGVPVYQRIAPLRVDSSCLDCHGDQHYIEGDVRGGLTVVLPMASALATIKQNRNNLILAWLAIICLVSTVIYVLLHRMVLRPVDHLSRVARRLIAGEYQVKARLATGDEFEAFARAFNQMTERLQQGYEGAIKSLVAAVEARDPYTRGHTARVGRYATAIAREMGLSQEQVAEIRIGAILHDIGKIGVADEILRKTSALNGEEQAEMAAHVTKGAKIIQDADFLLCALPAILYHHERPDGTGYPHGVAGESLPLISRIIAVADTFDAMTTDRPYRKALSGQAALAEIEKQAGSQFDREVVRCFRQVFDRGDVLAAGGQA